MTTDGPERAVATHRVALVASTGGHLAQLARLRPRIVPDGPQYEETWVTFDTPHSRSILADKNVVYVPNVGPRDYRTLVKNLPRLNRVLREIEPTTTISTGAAIAAALLPMAVARGSRAIYIESAARSLGPSLTGRLLEKAPRVETYSQYPGWHRPGWAFVGSVFDDYEPHYRDVSTIKKVVVTMGTIGYDFSRLVRRLEQILPASAEVIWQLGDTQFTPSLGRSFETLPASELAAMCRTADVIVAHAGIGSALMALDAGKVPVLVARSASHGEHVDNHQMQIAAELDGRRLAISSSIDDLSLETLERSASGTVERAARPAGLRIPPLG